MPCDRILPAAHHRSMVKTVRLSTEHDLFLNKAKRPILSSNNKCKCSKLSSTLRAKRHKHNKARIESFQAEQVHPVRNPATSRLHRTLFRLASCQTEKA